jgi:pimeloyl-ACP methyl ester carboxylesterase
MTRSTPDSTRRTLLLGVPALTLSSTALLAGCASTGPGSGGERTPIVFMHGNGDTAALWYTSFWRFESNGWPRERMSAVNAPYPQSRDIDAIAQPGRSSAEQNMGYLAAEVERVLAATRAPKVILIGNSRGGYAIRDFVKNGGGAPRVSHVILGGTPNHGVWATDYLPGSEFNGKGPFLSALNAPQGPQGLEITPGPKWLTVRSDNNDKYAQPDGRWIGRPDMATNVGYDGPALKGAENIVLPGLDHRELSFHPRAFAQDWRFIEERDPASIAIAVEAAPVLDGQISRPGTNLPLEGVAIEVYRLALDTGERIGPPVHRHTTGPDGRWGPMKASPGAPYEFVVAAPGMAIMHLYHSPFPRSSNLIDMRPVALTDAQKSAGSVVTLTRPRGYFDPERDTMSLDGAALPGVPPGVAGVSSSTIMLPEGPVRTVVAEFNGERIATRSWPARENRVVIAELHY